MPATVHMPPGTSNWKPGQHRPFAFITQNARGKPLVNHQAIIPLSTDAATDAGLTVGCRLDDTTYEKGIKASNAEMANLNIQDADFHGEWNYTFASRQLGGRCSCSGSDPNSEPPLRCR